MTENRIRLTAVIKTPADLAFIENAGGNIKRGAKQAGFDKLLAFAQMTPRAFQAFLNGHELADIGEIITVREGDYPDRCAALRVAADALDIAADWDIDRLDIKTPPDWEMGSGFCNTRALAQKLREIAGGIQCDANV